MKKITRLLMAGLWLVAIACASTDGTEPMIEKEFDAQDLIHVPSDPDSIGPECSQCL